MPPKHLIVDAHQDIAWNMLTFGRDYTRPVAETRRLEQDTLISEHTGDALLGWDAYQDGRVAVVFATMFAAPIRRQVGDWEVLCYTDTQEARKLYRASLESYQRLTEAHPDKFRLLHTHGDLKALLAEWPEKGEHPVGLVLLMEGAEGIGDVAELEDWWAAGLRIIGPAWAGTRFCGGTREPGPLTEEGHALLAAMAEWGYALDLSHMDESAVLQALDEYPGSMLVSHANAKALLKDTPSNRFLSDRVIAGVVARDGVIGVVPYNLFLRVGWTRADGRQAAHFSEVIDHIDHICQLAGDARHIGWGSDFDGGFGLQSVPVGIETLADLQKYAPLLAERGYTDRDISAIFGGNWLRLLDEFMPETP